MMQRDVQNAVAPTVTSAPDVPSARPAQASAAEATGVPTGALVEEDLLIEDVSIDGMCGVY
jgi:mycofactocin precursor